MSKHIITRLVTLFLAAFMLPAIAAFDPVNDDTDIFLANPDITAERPNVLIILDNTANWNQAFTNEKSALVQVVNGLDDRYNVGLMLFNQNQAHRQNPLDNGAFVAFHVRQMNSTNKSALASLVGGFQNDTYNNGGQKGDAAVTGMAMYEAYLYYAGKASRTGWNQTWADFPGNTYAAGQTSYTNALTDHAFLTAPTAATLYNSPAVDGCQKNYIIYISNGAANESSNLRSELAGYLKTLTDPQNQDPNAPTAIPLTPNGQQGNWADEVAQYAGNADVNSTLANSQNIITYTVDVDPATTGQGPSMSALLSSMASASGGNYYATSSGNSGVSIVDTLNNIFAQVQAVNSVFAATTLPVSVNVRGTNLDQVYVGTFRPDAKKAPRWFGNLKAYKLGLNTTNNSLYLIDKNGNAAEDNSTHFVVNTATSYWTSSTLTPTNFWAYRASTLNGVGGSSDAPDGNLVEKGGAGQQLRHYYQADQSTRNLYTCTTGGNKPNCVACTPTGSGTNKTCTSGSALSATPFDTTNSAIDATALNLSTQAVSALTAKRSVTITALTDRKAATINDLASGSTATPTIISSGTTTSNISSLTTAGSVTISSLTGAGSQVVSINKITKSGSTYTLTSTSTLPSAFIAGATVTVAYTGSTKWGTVTIATVPTTTTFTTTTAAGGSETCTSCPTITATASVNSTTITATTATPHGFLAGETVTISGASPGFNTGSCSGSGGSCIIASVPSATSFTYTVTAGQGAAATPGTASANSQVITATTSATHAFVAGDQVIISGATPSGYNGTYTVLGPAISVASVGKDSTTNFSNVTGWPAPTTLTFRLFQQNNVIANLLTPNTATPVYAVKTTGATSVTSLTLTFASNPFLVGQTLSISSSAVSSYNTTSCLVTSITSTTAICTISAVSGPLPNDTAATASATNGAVYGNTVTATVTAHGFATGNQVMVESVSGADSNYTGAGAGPYTITVVDANTFTYTTAFASPHAPIGTYRIRLGGTTAPKAYVTATAHGFLTNDSVTISGATPSAYNGTYTVTMLDANNFTYNLSAISPEDVTQQGTATVLGTASINTTTATATAVNHGFSTAASITISGASPSAFNGTFPITVTDTNNFTYTLPSAQGDATGATITATAAAASGTLRDDIINWVRGADNSEHENSLGLTTDIRPSIHGDVLHSRPAVINYNRFGGSNDVYAFYGANDGVFHAVKAGTATDSADNSGFTPGQEVWGFIPTDFFSTLQRLRNNSPIISSSLKKPYFADGPIGTLTIDANNNSKLGDSGDTVNLYIGMHRGGRFIYALDINTPSTPNLLWKISNTTTGFSELGQTWSEPRVVPRDTSLDCSLNGYKNPVLIFGAGYDPTVEDLDPAAVTVSTSTSVTANSITYNRSMGRGIYVVDAVTGELVVSIGGSNSAIAPNKVVSGMDYAIASDVAVIQNQTGGCTNRAYVGDTSGNVWRLDFAATYNSASPGSWVTVTEIASVGGSAANKRKFLFQPDVVAETGYDAVLIGSGDREHPFDTTVTNRMYMIRDRGNDSAPYTGTSIDILPAGSPDGVADYPTVVETALYDATNDCLQVTTGACSSTTISAEVAALAAKEGWYVTLGSGEKNVGSVIATAGTVFFNTNQPSASAGGGSCGTNLGIARQYQLGVVDATATSQLDTTNSLFTAADRSRTLAGGGYLPSPVHVVVQFIVGADGVVKGAVGDTDSNGNPITAAAGDTTITADGIVSGFDVDPTGGGTVGSRFRRYWYKEIDQ